MGIRRTVYYVRRDRPQHHNAPRPGSIAALSADSRSYRRSNDHMWLRWQQIFDQLQVETRPVYRDDLIDGLRELPPFAVPLDTKQGMSSVEDEAHYFDMIKRLLSPHDNPFLAPFQLVAMQGLFTRSLGAGHFNELLAVRPHAASYFDDCLNMARCADSRWEKKSSAFFLSAIQGAQPFVGTGEMLPAQMVISTLSAVKWKLDRDKAEAATQYLLDTQPNGQYELDDLAKQINSGRYSEAQQFAALRRNLQNNPSPFATHLLMHSAAQLPHNRLWQRYGRMVTHSVANKIGSPYELETLRGVFGFVATPRQQEQAIVRLMWRGMSWEIQKDLLQRQLTYPAVNEEGNVYREAGLRHLADQADRIGQLEDLKKNFGYQASVKDVVQVAERTQKRWQKATSGPAARL